MNRTSADVIPLCSTAVPTPDKVWRIARNVLGDYTCWPSIAQRKSAKIELERSRFRSRSIAVEDRDLDIDLDDRNSTSCLWLAGTLSG